MKNKLILAAAAVLALPMAVSAQVKTFEIIDNPVEQGGTAVIRIFPQWRGSLICISAFGKYFAPDRFGYVYIGVGTDVGAAKYRAFRVECGRGIRLDGGYYDEIDVSVKNFKKIRTAGGGPSSRPRQQSERDAINAAFSSDNGLKKDLTGGIRYLMPVRVKTEVIDPFGLIFSNVDTLLHSGVDLRLLIGTRVQAANSGRIILVADDYSKEGNMVIISHGLGIFSVYMHLWRIDVKNGDLVVRGQTIGLSGETGAGVREPHLHFSVKINGAYVDPLEFIETVNKNR
ncbi:MAG: M23 family metallopeptidase [Candidatus Yanofskybacteria bacterium]|nr:M23 family metallopeptidase [Candidatus Yanofskybacteria bacterium]